MEPDLPPSYGIASRARRERSFPNVGRYGVLRGLSENVTAVPKADEAVTGLPENVTPFRRRSLAPRPKPVIPNPSTNVMIVVMREASNKMVGGADALSPLHAIIMAVQAEPVRRRRVTATYRGEQPRFP